MDVGAGYQKTHILDLFGPILDPIGYRLDLTTYYDEAEIPVRLSVVANANGAVAASAAVVASAVGAAGAVDIIVFIVLSLSFISSRHFPRCSCWIAATTIARFVELFCLGPHCR